MLQTVLAQQQALLTVSLDFDGASEARKEAIEIYVARGLETRGIRKLSDNGLDPKDHAFDDYAWVIIKPVGELASPYALNVQLSILQGASANYMLYRFRGSLASAALQVGTTREAMGSALDQQLRGLLDQLMDEAKQAFGTPAYRHGWHPRNG